MKFVNMIPLRSKLALPEGQGGHKFEQGPKKTNFKILHL